MSTIVTFHAHPDDECIGTGGLLALAASLGHRTVLVTATDGRHGEIAPGTVAEHETLTHVRSRELAKSAEILGVSRLVELGYPDSGMMGTPQNDDPDCFWQADVEVAAAQLAAVLVEEQADVLTVYDSRGGYGHPDHIQVHRVGYRAAELAGIAAVYQATMNRDMVLAQWRLARDNGIELGFDPDDPEMELGTPAAEITHALDVSAFVETKRAAMRAHASQIPDDSIFLTMPDDIFAASFGVEHYIHRDGQPGRHYPLPL
jgi:LmbE family N-acetylglucosaminyl deacetylase